MPETVLTRIVDHVADIWLACQGIARELDQWNAAPRSGRIFINGVESMTTADITDIPTNDVPCRVDWADRLGGQISHDKTQTSWSVEDAEGSPFAGVTIEPDTSDSEEETGTVTFNTSTGRFKIVATTPGANGDVRAESGLYNIVPGAAAIGMITVSA